MAKVKLNALPMTLGGVTVLANHYRWGLPAVYSLAEIIQATPGATYNLEDYRVAMGPPVSSNEAYWQGDLLDASTAWAILAYRLRQLGKIPANSFPEVQADHREKAEANRKAVLNLIVVSGRDNWATVRTGLETAVEYDGPVRTPVWEAI